MTIETQLNEVGHARVLVVLKPKKTRSPGRTAVALNETIELQQHAAHKLVNHFRSFRNSRRTLLEQELSQALPDGEEVEIAVDDRERQVIGRTNKVRYFPYLGLMYGTVDEKGLTALREQTDEVESVISPPDFSLIRPVQVAALAAPDPGVSWGISRLKADELWQKGFTGEGVLVGHLDTGIDDQHPALAGAVDVFAEFDLVGRQVSRKHSYDTNYHGTHTAGIIVGKPYGGVIFGVAPDAKLASGLVIEGGDVPARVFGGLNWCVGQGVRVVNLSLGLRGYEPQFSTVLSLLRQRDVLPVVAIGNEGVHTSRSPGNLPEALSVGAIDQSNQIWIGSSSQRFAEKPARIVPTLIAPGVDVWSCYPGGTMMALSGTSMAAPHIAGLAALLIQARPHLPVGRVEQAMVQSAQRPSGVGTLRGNRGVPDAVEALKRL